MPYTRFRYHIVTATQDRQPLITENIELVLYDKIKRKAEALGGRILYVNGTVDHIHMIAAIPPAITVSSFIGDVKSASSLYVNQQFKKEDKFFWQRGYGAFTVDPENMQGLIKYVLRQKEHHAQGTVIERFERVEE